jgi:hypothetical protein
MAAQRRLHTADQVRGLLKSSSLHKCPNCLEEQAKVLESRKVEEGRRRRFHCEACEHRFTLVEITQESYSELKSIKAKYIRISSIIGNTELLSSSVPEIEDETILCVSCNHYCPEAFDKCSFCLPEVDTEDATGCNLFAPKK